MKYFIKSKLRSKASRERLKRWLEAMESGEYKKAIGDYYARVVHDGEGVAKDNCCFCALGVAAVVNDADMRDLYDDLFCNLLGFKPSAHDAVVYLNDIDGLPFKVIAERIRHDLKSGGISID